MSKGAFYHYYDSKQSMLEALIIRLLDEVEPLVVAIEESEQPAVDRLNAFFKAVGHWNVSRSKEVMTLLLGWYSDDTILLRNALRIAGRAKYVPLFSTIITAGNQEGVFACDDPNQTARLLHTILGSMSEQMAETLLDQSLSNSEKKADVCAIIASDTQAIERILGAPQDTIFVADKRFVQQWIDL